MILRYKIQLVLALVALTGAATATLLVPLAVRHMIDDGFGTGDDVSVNQTFFLLILVVSFLACMSAMRYYFVMWLGERVVADLRKAVFGRLLSLDIAFFDQAKTGELISRLTADTTQIKSAVGASASIALRNLFLFFGATVMMVVTSPRLSSFVLVAIPFIVLPLVLFGRKVRKKSRIAQDTLADASAFASEHVSAIRTVRSFSAEERTASSFATSVEAAFHAARHSIAARSILTAFAIFMVFASVVGVLWIGAQDVLSGRITAGELGQFLLYSVFAAGALGELSQVWGEISLASGAAERLTELLDQEPSLIAVQPVYGHKTLEGHIRFENVCFGYGDANPVLDTISLEIMPGEHIAIVGPSGAGKSTIFSLLMRFYDVTSGRVFIDHYPLKQFDPVQLRHTLAVVPQDVTIFGATVLDNIRFGSPHATKEEVIAAAKAANADSFIEELSQSYDTQIGERGVTLSGGQRQRIAIARAILKDAPILLLDEATSALDAESEGLVQDALERLMKGRTSLVIAHRLATVKHADRIIVMDKGRIVEEGTHESLSTKQGLYAKLAHMQFDG
jgi:ATP-binding cassette subfamily B protein